MWKSVREIDLVGLPTLIHYDKDIDHSMFDQSYKHMSSFSKEVKCIYKGKIVTAITYSVFEMNHDGTYLPYIPYQEKGIGPEYYIKESNLTKRSGTI